MADTSDRYTDWLGIPKGPRPPDHYTLLGLERFESDSKVIEQAAVARVRKVRPLCMKFASEASQLLNEISKARLCLNDSEERNAYDDGLRRSNLPVVELSSSKPALKDHSDRWEDDDDEPVDWDRLFEVAALSIPSDPELSPTTGPKPKRYCPHCGSSLLAKETVCMACSRGLARANDWISVSCPSCQKFLLQGAVMCLKCKVDHALSSRDGTLPPRIANTIRPFQYRDSTRKTDAPESETYTLQGRTEAPKKKRPVAAPRPIPSKAVIDALNAKLRPGWKALRKLSGSPFRQGTCARCGIAMPLLEDQKHVAPARGHVLHAVVSETAAFMTAFQVARLHFFGLSLGSLPPEPGQQIIMITESIERMVLTECDRCGGALCLHCSKANSSDVGCTLCAEIPDDEVKAFGTTISTTSGATGCPQCGFSYRWSGTSCGHCHYPDEMPIPQGTKTVRTGTEAGCATAILFWMTSCGAMFWMWLSL